MQIKLHRLTCWLTVLLVICSSCGNLQKIVKTKDKLNELRGLIAEEDRQLKKIDEQTQGKRQVNKIDSVISTRYDFTVKKINSSIKDVAGLVHLLDSLLADPALFRQSYYNLVQPALARLDSFKRSRTGRMEIYLMMEDGINIANYTLFDLAAFFGSGKYTIPVTQEQSTMQAFAPLVDSVLRFSLKYRRMPRKATLVVLGFADGEGFEPGSPLYNELAKQVDHGKITKQDLNQQLSALRAAALVQQLKIMFSKKTGSKRYKNLQLEFIGLGKGEHYPFDTIRDYRENDERRRIVLCYWAVLPG